MNSISEIIHQASGDDRQISGGKYVCEVCGESYDYTNTLSLPSTGYSGYQIYDTYSERYICVCEDCVDALQEAINSQHQRKKGA